jgi:hypothetical protein
MSLPQASEPAADCPEPLKEPRPCPEALDDLRERMHQRLDEAIDACLNERDSSSFLAFETTLQGHLSALGLLLSQLFLLVRHLRLDLNAWRQRGYQVCERYAPRTLHTSHGPLRYGRAYLTPAKGKKPGVHPLDVALGLTRDSFTPLIISWFCRLCTRLSFRVACDLGGMFLGWAPAASTVEGWVLGLGRPAQVWLSTGPVPEDDGEVLIIECDGKAAPTATDEEMAKRRQPHHPPGCTCGCPRHRARCARKARSPRKKRKRGDKSKNGRSATLVVMYTLKRGEDGRLHGPCNKKVYASFSCRRKVLQWARQQATRRGFAPDTTKTVQLVVDGEECLERQLRRLFPKAVLTLDLRHAQERLWRVGRLLHAEGSEELAAWVEPLAALLYQGQVAELLQRLASLCFVGPGSKNKRSKRDQAVNYLRKRQGLMDYGRWREQDLVLASGMVEGAARHVVGERLDQSGMRWLVERAEAVLLLRCIEVNGDWEAFFAWSEQRRLEELRQGRIVQIRSQTPTQRPQTSKEAERARQRRKAARNKKKAKVAA